MLYVALLLGAQRFKAAAATAPGWSVSRSRFRSVTTDAMRGAAQPSHLKVVDFSYAISVFTGSSPRCWSGTAGSPAALGTCEARAEFNRCSAGQSRNRPRRSLWGWLVRLGAAARRAGHAVIETTRWQNETRSCPIPGMDAAILRCGWSPAQPPGWDIGGTPA